MAEPEEFQTLSAPQWEELESVVVGEPCGMSNPQAALIAAAIGTSQYVAADATMVIAKEYLAWLDDVDEERRVD
jgi:hypothetical protein